MCGNRFVGVEFFGFGICVACFCGCSLYRACDAFCVGFVPAAAYWGYPDFGVGCELEGLVGAVGVVDG